MPSILPTIYVFGAVYIGNSTDNSVLVPIVDLRTNGAQITSGVPTIYVPSIGNYVQTGNQIAKVTLTFLSKSQMMQRLVRGLPVGATLSSSPLFNNQTYSLLLVGPDDGTETTYYWPKLSVEKNWDKDHSKDKALSTQITLDIEDPLVTTRLQYFDTFQNIKTIMGARSPI